MMRGYKCQHKSAEAILTSLGFDPKGAIRGWTMNRTAGVNNAGAPVRMHAIVNRTTAGEFIDIHADLPGPNNTHVTQRGRRTERWNQLFAQIDRDEFCDAGNKLLAHYDGLRLSLITYNERFDRTEM